MAKYKEVPCMYYICKGQCSKGREAEQKGYCQHCSKYRPRAKLHLPNKKKMYNEKEKSKIY